MSSPAHEQPAARKVHDGVLPASGGSKEAGFDDLLVPDKRCAALRALLDEFERVTGERVTDSGQILQILDRPGLRISHELRINISNLRLVIAGAKSAMLKCGPELNMELVCANLDSPFHDVQEAALVAARHLWKQEDFSNDALPRVLSEKLGHKNPRICALALSIGVDALEMRDLPLDLAARAAVLLVGNQSVRGAFNFLVAFMGRQELPEELVEKMLRLSTGDQATDSAMLRKVALNSDRCTFEKAENQAAVLGALIEAIDEGDEAKQAAMNLLGEARLKYPEQFRLTLGAKVRALHERAARLAALEDLE